MVWGMRTRHIIARWLGYHHELVTAQAENTRLANKFREAYGRTQRQMRRYRHDLQNAETACSIYRERVKVLEEELRDREAQVQALLARCRANRAATMEAEDRMGRAHTLVARARHTMNINPKGAQAMLDQAVSLLEGDR